MDYAFLVEKEQKTNRRNPQFMLWKVMFLFPFGKIVSIKHVGVFLSMYVIYD